MQEPDAHRLQQVIDRQDILDCLTRYARGVDRLDRDLLLSAYHPDAQDDHGLFAGPAAEFADWALQAHREGQTGTMHVLGNHTCELDGDTAHTETYCTYFGYNVDGSIEVIGNRYIDRLEKRNGEWRISDRICVIDWSGALKSGVELNPITERIMADLISKAPTGRDHTDVSYRRPLHVVRNQNIPR